MLPTVAHVAAGGGVPAQLEFMFAAALLSVACVALADRRRHPAEIGTFLLLSQAPLHLLLSLGGHNHPATVSTATMILAHVAAAAVLTVLLSGIESVVWAFAALSATVLFDRLRELFQPSPIASPARRVPAAPDGVGYPATLAVATSAPRRGPPLAPAPATR